METTMNRPVCRNHFEEVGVKLQEGARNWAQSVERFDKSCTLCSMHDHDCRKDCNACPIREAMLANIQYFGFPKDDYYPWLEKELAQA